MTTRRNHSGLEGSGAPAVRRGPREWRLLEWQVVDEQSFRLARIIKLSLGKLPQRLAKFGKARFDLEEERKYGIGQDEKVAGRDLAGLAAYLVRCAAKPPADYLMSLKGIPAALIEPMKAYLRVKLAIGRLEAEIEGARRVLESDTQNTTPASPPQTAVIPEFAKQIPGTSQEQDNVESIGAERSEPSVPNSPKCKHPASGLPPPRSRMFSTENAGMTAEGAGRSNNQLKKPKSFTWDISPAKAYGFKEMTAAYGYDPRNTSAYWIEKRANALRRKWAAHGQEQIGGSRAVVRNSAVKALGEVPSTERVIEPEVRHFEPADADYNTVWPPVELPGGPPKCTLPAKPTSPPSHTLISEVAAQISGASQGQTECEVHGAAKRAIKITESSKLACSETSSLPPRCPILSSKNSGMTAEGWGEDAFAVAEGEGETIQNSAPISPKFQAIRDAAIAARKEAQAAGRGLRLPEGYIYRSGMFAPLETAKAQNCAPRDNFRVPGKESEDDYDG